MPRRNRTGGLIGKLHRQRGLTGSRISREVGGRRRRSGDVDERTLAAGGPAAAGDRQRDREVGRAAVSVRWSLDRAMRRTIAEIPVPGRDRAGGLVKQLPRQGHIARTRMLRETPREPCPRLILI